MIISVSQFNNLIRGVLESEDMLRNLSVKGEISNCRFSNTNYFSIKDDNAQIDCYIPNGVSPFALENGQEVVVHGYPNFYVKGGRLSFYVRKIELTDKLGSAFAKLLAIKEKLEKEGCFEQSTKKIVPTDNIKIGVVTSATGAVITDIVTVSQRRNPAVDIILYPTKVQGEGAEYEIANGIDYFSRSDVSVIIVGRGGGSNEDLSAFNTEVVVRAICRCSKPTVSAVGHGIDFSLCDFACDKRVATPTEAAEITTTDAVSAVAYMLILVKRIQNIVANKCDELFNDVFQNLSAIQEKTSSIQKLAEKNFFTLTERLDSLSVLKKFAQGFAYVSKNGCKTDYNNINVGDSVELTFAKGKTIAEIIEKR